MFQKMILKMILPFFCMGLLLGIVIGKASWLRSFGWMNEYLAYAKINTNYVDSGQTIFLDHFDASILMYLLIAILVTGALQRVYFGVRDQGYRSAGVIQTLATFGSLLAIAWLGMILGISIPTFLFQGYGKFVTFFLYIIYPLLFLIKLEICTAFLSGKLLAIVGLRGVSKLGIRVEGLVVMGIALTMLTYQELYFASIRSFTRWANSMLLPGLSA
jgi:hypothetical protein